MADFPLDLGAGFIALPRGLLESQAYRALTVGARAVLLTVLERAQFRPGVVWVGSRRIELAPGQLLDSEEALAKRSGTTRKVTRSALARLEVGGFLVRRPVLQEGQHAGRCPHIISVCEYEKLSTRRGAEAPLEGPQEAPQEGQFRANSGPIQGQFRAPSEEREPGNQVNHVNQEPFGAPTARRGSEAAKSGPRVRKKPADPRREPFVAAAFRVYAEIRGGERLVFDKSDGRSLGTFLASQPAVTLEEFETRWRRSLAAPFHRCARVRELVSKWGHFSATAQDLGQPRLAPPARGSVIAPAAPHSAFVGGEVKL